jgi:hypothetical protein
MRFGVETRVLNGGGSAGRQLTAKLNALGSSRRVRVFVYSEPATKPSLV